LEGSDDDLILACLKLRQCIEALSYGLLVTYQHELSQSAIMTWQPRKVLDELQAADPLANTSREITIEVPRKGAREAITISGEDRRFSPKWAGKAYNKLGSFLHVPTPKMFEAKSEASKGEIRRQCKEYAEFLKQVFETEVWHFMSGQFVSHTCDCGFLIKRRVESINKDTVFECAECDRKYDLTYLDANRAEITLRVARWACPSCNSSNETGAHELREGMELTCPQCGKIIEVERAWAFS
jgi:rubrerythrin